MRKILGLVAIFVAAIISGCNGNSLYGPQGGGSSSVATVNVVTSLAQIAPDDSTIATITATVRDSGNNFVKDATVTFTASAGGLAITQAKTDASGVATATLRAAGSAPGTAITVTAAVNGASGSTVVTVLATQQTMTILTSVPQIPSDSSAGATITAVVRGPNNNFLVNVPVNFSATSGGLSSAQGLTNQNGAATTTLTAASDPTNRRITVTASTGPVTQTIDVDVTGSKLAIIGPPSLVLGSSGQYVATLSDSGGKPISNRAVTLASARGNTITPTATITSDANGQSTFTLAASVGGAETLTATALGLTAQQLITVSSDTFSVTAPASGASINLGVVTPVSARWLVGGAPQVGQTISFAATRGTLSAATAVTDGTGTASVTLNSSAAGASTITATTPTASTASTTVTFVATNPTNIIVQASPANVPVNTQSTISAVVRDAMGNLVQGQSVAFSLADVTGGSLSVASALTDAQGRAQTVYTSGNTASAPNAVSITGTIPGTALTSTTTLTVSGRTVFLSLGTGNTIASPTTTQYRIDYAVQAIDSAGNGVDGIPISFTIHSLTYQKGTHVFGVKGAFWSAVYSTPLNDGAVPPVPLCPNEDSNFNGILEPGLGEDVAGYGNNNGRLEPGDVASVFPGTTTTANGGTAIGQITYPKDHADWVQVILTATATVSGTETSKTAVFWLAGASTDYNNSGISPPGFNSPYGTSANCTDTL